MSDSASAHGCPVLARDGQHAKTVGRHPLFDVPEPVAIGRCERDITARSS